MWFEFPKGTDQINVQLQEFRTEFTGEDGREYFRAPDHFAGIILDLPGFKSVRPPEGAPEDLPKADPLRDGAINQLGSQNEALKMENESLKAANAEIRAINDNLKVKLNEALTELGNIKAEKEETSEGKPKK